MKEIQPQVRVFRTAGCAWFRKSPEQGTAGQGTLGKQDLGFFPSPVSKEIQEELGLKLGLKGLFAFCSLGCFKILIPGEEEEQIYKTRGRDFCQSKWNRAAAGEENKLERKMKGRKINQNRRSISSQFQHSSCQWKLK